MGLDLQTGDSYLSNGHSSDPPDPSYSFVIDSIVPKQIKIVFKKMIVETGH